MSAMTRASCLCGAVTWTLAGPVPAMFHCHCTRCRKAHGTAFATYVSAPAQSVALEGTGDVTCWRPPQGGDNRCFCRRCGSVVPYSVEDTVFAPAGNFDDDPGVRPRWHMFVRSRAPWYEIRDGLPRFETYPPGRAAAPVVDRPSLDPPGRPRGSCLCGAVAFIVEGEPVRCRYCHCGRCRKALSAAHATNMTTALDGVRFTRGEDMLARYQVPEARFFATVFCSGCGSPMPRRHPDHRFSVVPLGSLDDDPGARSTGHIFVASKAPWFDIADDLPQQPAYSPGE
jgi:hypothetical protein